MPLPKVTFVVLDGIILLLLLKAVNHASIAEISSWAFGAGWRLERLRDSWKVGLGRWLAEYALTVATV